MSDVVRVEVADRIATVTLNRPDKLNAMSRELFAALLEAGERVAADEDVRAVLVRGEGRAFSSGLDVSALGSFAGDGSTAVLDRDIARLQDSFDVWARMPKPVVAAVQGYAFGGGIQLALACDLRVVATDAVFSVYEITYGLVPDLGGTQRLPRVVGPGRAKELIWTARKFGAQEAEAWGIANRVCEPDALLDEAMTLCRDLASRPPIPVALAKELVDLAGRVPVSQGLREERRAQMVCLGSKDTREAVAAAFEDRDASYTGT